MATEKQLAYCNKLKGKKLSEEHRKKLSFSRTLEGYVDRLGIKEGTKAYYDKNKKLSVGVESLRERGYTEEEILDIRQKHADKSKITKKSMMTKYGNVLGLEKYDNWKTRQKRSSKRSIEYWLREFDGNKTLANEALRIHQSKDIKFFIDRYGEIDGVIKYENYVKAKTKSFQNRTFNNSKTELEIGQKISELISENMHIAPHRYYIFLDDIEQQILNKKFIIPDMTIPDLKIAIEYYGDYWHCSEEMFEDETVIHPFIKKSVKEIREHDKRKLEVLNNKGWKVIVIWEHDYKENKEETIKKVLNEYSKMD